MKGDIPSIWRSMKAKGYSRREFLYFCGVAVAAAGEDEEYRERIDRLIQFFSNSSLKGGGLC